MLDPTLFGVFAPFLTLSRNQSAGRSGLSGARWYHGSRDNILFGSFADPVQFD
jgi:hypothetical protein